MMIIPTRVIVILIALVLQESPSVSLTYKSLSQLSLITGMRQTTTIATFQAARSPLAAELDTWATSNNFGSIQQISPSGSSSWASFHKVSVTNPPTDGQNRTVSFFVKSSSRSLREMFYGEAIGLQAMYACSTHTHNDSHDKDVLRIPKVYHYADFSGENKGSFLIMEYLNLAGRSDDRALGRAMARMHLAPPVKDTGNPNQSFGFPVDNTIGGTPQPNRWTKPNSGTQEWIEFFRDYRMGHQLNHAGDSYCTNLWNNDIVPRLHLLFEGLYGEKEIKPSLLHGDLWSGNIGSADGKPTVFDPAVYWGHHEAEWGMSWCAGFGYQFWEGYRSLLPEEEGFQERKPLYDAYHQLNHYNLFGGSYLGSARSDLENLKRSLIAKESKLG